MTATINDFDARQQVRAWAREQMKGKVFDPDLFLFDQVFHASVVDPRTGFLKCQYDLGKLSQVKKRQRVRSFDRLHEAGVVKFADAGQLLLVYIPKQVGS